MARFMTRRYVAVTWTEALRLAALDGTPWAEIRQAEEVQLLHREEWWAWWSDEQLTTAIGLPESLCPETLSPDAVSLISEVWESFSPAPQCGWRTLARVKAVLRRTNWSHPQGSVPDRRAVTELLIVQFTDDSEGVLQCWRRALGEGYECHIERLQADD